LKINFLSKLIAAGVLAAFLFFPSRAHPSTHIDESLEVELIGEEGVFVVGEELTYNVSYSVFNLGSVRIQVIDTLTKMGTKVYRAKAYINSYNVPFVDLHQVFYSEVSPQPYSVYFSMNNTANPEKIPYSWYSFNYSQQRVDYEIGTKPGKVVMKQGNEPIDNFQQDGLSLFYYARKNVREKKKMAVPTFISEKSFLTSFNFMNKVGSQQISAVNYPVETVEFDGNANFIGIFGMTGYFQGFFSNDEAAVPIAAKMKVLVGNITIELVKWNRPGWIPPRAKQY